MKRKDLITIVEDHLNAFGFKRGTWLWQPRSSELCVVINGAIKTLKLKTSMTKRALLFEMGRLAGICEAAGVMTDEMMNMARASIEGKPSARPAQHKGNGVAHWGSDTIGMPA